MSDFIEIYDDALDGNLCDQIIQQFEASPVKQQGSIGHGIDKTKKDSIDLTINGLSEWQSAFDQVMDVTLRSLIDYMKKYRFLLCGATAITMQDVQSGQPFTLDHESFERLDDTQIGGLIFNIIRPGDLNIQKYDRGRGGYHHWHSEIYPRSADCEALHRILLFMFYLNTVDDGGETEFFYQQQKIPAQQGRMVIAPAGFTHTHKGHIPTSHDKYILTSWVLFQRCENLYQT